MYGLSQLSKYKIPSVDRAGNITGYKSREFPKTVYDPKVLSDDQIFYAGQKAAKKGYLEAISNNERQFSSEAEGITFRAYIRNGMIDNFHPEFGE